MVVTGRTSVRRAAAVLSAAVVLSCSLVMHGTFAWATTVTTVKGGFAWGNNQTGELDDGTTTERNTPVSSIGLSGVTTMSAGLSHCLALRSNGTVIAWGHNRSGQLGDGTTTDRPSPAGVLGLSGVRRVSAGGAFSEALKSDGTVLAWGHDSSGELGNGTTNDSSIPVPVSGLGAGSGVIQISAGGAFSLALKSDGTVLTWGNNASGELGNGTTKDSSKPVHVSGLGAGSGVIQISAGGAFSLALKSDGTVLTWGNNASGELGNGTTKDSAKPVHVSGLGAGSGVIQISAGEAFSLALKSDGTVLAWGHNASGELGTGTASTDASKPVHVSGLRGVTRVSAGWAHALALIGGGTVYAWGDNALGQIGNGSTSPAYTPVPVGRFGSNHVLGVYAGGNHSHALFGSVAAHPSPSPSRAPSPSPSSTHSPTPSPTNSATKDGTKKTNVSRGRGGSPPVVALGGTSHSPGSTVPRANAIGAETGSARPHSSARTVALVLLVMLATAILIITALLVRERDWGELARRSVLGWVHRGR